MPELSSYTDVEFEGVSAAIKPLGGYDPQDLIGSKYQDIMHPDDRVRAASRCARSLTRKTRLTGEYVATAMCTSVDCARSDRCAVHNPVCPGR